MHLSIPVVALGIALPALWLSWLISRVGGRRILNASRIPSVEEAIADAERTEAEHQGEVDRLRALAPTDLPSAELLREHLEDDLARTREALAEFKARGHSALIQQFSEEQTALASELRLLEPIIAHLRLPSGAA